MDKMNNDNVIKQYELLKKMIIYYRDALNDVFGKYELCISKNNTIFIKSESGKKFIYIPGSIDKNCICFSTKDEYSYDGFCFELVENEISVNEIKVDLHKKGANVEFGFDVAKGNQSIVDYCKETNGKFINFAEKYADLICTDFPREWLPEPEIGYVPPKNDLGKLADTIAENGFVEKYCLDEDEVKQIRLIRYYRKNFVSNE